MPGMPLHVERPWPRRALLLAFVLLAATVPTAYTLYTDHIWEDYFITFRHSQNLCEGKGLVYNEGERVHGFTSPLGTLLPALCYVATGGESYEPALWVFRGLCIAAFVVGGLLLLLAVPPEQPHGWLIQLGIGLLYAFEAKAVAFTTNGMETALMLLFLGWGLYLFTRDVSRHWLAFGVCWAGLMWTRPDGCIYVAALGLGALLFVLAPRRLVFVGLLKSAAVCTALYLPWFAGTWVYYGSPVPHTVKAKSGLDSSDPWDVEQQASKFVRRYPDVAANMFRPVYYAPHEEEGWYPTLNWLTLGLGVFATFYWLVPVKDPLGRMTSFCFAAVSSHFCLAVTHIYPWYMPPVAMFGVVAVASGVVTLLALLPLRAPVPAALAAGLLLALVGERAYLLVLLSEQMKAQQAIIEMGNRRRIGEWLKEHVRPGERIHLEPVGYVGYFSEANIQDWPGLVSPTVVRLRKEKGLKSPQLEAELRPEWMVLRPGEALSLEQYDFFKKDYQRVRVFDVSDRVEACGALPGRGYLEFDSRYYVYRRKDLPPLDD